MPTTVGHRSAAGPKTADEESERLISILFYIYQLDIMVLQH